MRKLLLLLSVILSSMAFVTHAQAIEEVGWTKDESAGTLSKAIQTTDGTFTMNNGGAWGRQWKSTGLTPSIEFLLNANDCGTTVIKHSDDEDSDSYFCFHAGNTGSDVIKLEVPFHYNIVSISFVPLIASDTQNTTITFPGQLPITIAGDAGKETVSATTNGTATNLYVCNKVEYQPENPQNTIAININGTNTHCTFKDFTITIKHKTVAELKEAVLEEVTALSNLAPMLNSLLEQAQSKLDELSDDLGESDEALLTFVADLLDEQDLDKALNEVTDGQLFNIESPFGPNASFPMLASNADGTQVVGAAKNASLPSQIWVIEDPNTENGFLLRNYLNNKYIKIPTADNTATTLVDKDNATRFAFGMQNITGAVGINIFQKNSTQDHKCLHRNDGSVVRWGASSGGSVWKLATAEPVISGVTISPKTTTVVPGGTVEFTTTNTWVDGAPQTETFISYAVTDANEAAVTEGITIDGNNITFANEGPFTVTATSMNLKTATATVTVAKTKYAVTFNPSSITPDALSATTTVGVTVAQDGGESYTGTWTATLSQKGENDEYTTIEAKPTVVNSNSLIIPELEVGDYKLTIAPAEADQATTEFTNAELTFTVVKPVYGVTFNPTARDFTMSTTDASKEVSVTVAQAAAEEGGESTPYNGTWTATLSKKGEGDVYTTVENKTTVAEGKVTISALEAGDYKLTIAPVASIAAKIEFENAEFPFTVAQTTYTVTFDPASPAMTTEATSQTPITVTIKNGDEEQTIDWSITFEKKDGEEYKTATGAEKGTGENAGKVVFTNLEAGTYRLTVNAPADAAYVLSPTNVLEFTVTKADAPQYAVAISADGASVKEVTMTTAETKTLNVTFSKGGEEVTTDAPTDWTAKLTSSKGTASTITPDNGAIELSGLAADTYTLSIVTESTEYTIAENSLTVTVTAAPVAISGIEITTAEADLAVEIAADATTGTVAVAGKVTPADATIPAGAKVTFAVKDEQALPTGLTIGEISAANIDATTGTFSTVITATLEATATLTEAAQVVIVATYTTETGEAKTAEFTITVTKADAEETTLSINEITAPDQVSVVAETEGLTAVFTVTVNENSALPTPADFNVVAKTVVVAEEGAVTVAKVAEKTNEYTVTVAYSAPTVTEENTPATIVLTAKADDTKTATATITVTAATVEPTVGEIKGVASIEDATVAIAEGAITGEATINGKLTIDPSTANAPTTAELTIAAETTAEGVESVTISDITINKDGSFTATATVTLAADTEITEDTEVEVTLTPSVGDPLTLKLTLTPKTETPAELPVEVPTEDLPTGTTVDIATDAETGAQTATIDFNATPATEDGTAAEKPELTVTLPTTAEVENFEQEFSVEITDESGDASTAATVEFVPASEGAKAGIKINAAGAKIGDIIKIIIRKLKAANAQTLAPTALLADEGEEGTTEPETPVEGEETPADDDIVLTINVTIYGVEFTKAPSTATLGMDNTVNVTFETNACVPAAKEDAPEVSEQEDTPEAAEEDAPAVILSVDGEGATVSGKVITFTQAGTYTVTAKAGDNYAATTTITVKEAPTVTGIEAVNADAAAGNATVYDLKGRRLNRVNAAGIYIVNGVKTLVR